MKRAVVFVLVFLAGYALGSIPYAGVPDVQVKEERAARAYYRSCVAKSQAMFGTEWNRYIKACQLQADSIRWRLIDLHGDSNNAVVR